MSTSLPLPPALTDLAGSPVLGLLLESRIPARLAWVAPDGAPRVAPLWFTWTGESVVVSTFAGSAKLAGLVPGVPVALCIDTEDFPARSVTMRGVVATVEAVRGLTPEYEAAAMRYLGERMGRTWCAALPAAADQVRVEIRPTSAVVVDMAVDLPFFAGAR